MRKAAVAYESSVAFILDKYTNFVYSVNMNDTMRRILQAALEVFGNYGYRQANMALVAEAAGLSRQALYTYFATKDELFRAIVDYLHSQSIERALKAMTEAEANGPAAVFYALLEGRYGYFFEHIYTYTHGTELVAESNRQCGELNLAATRHFQSILHEVVEREVVGGRLTLASSDLQTDMFADLLLRAAYGLKGREPYPLPLEAFRASLRHMVTLLTASLIP